MRKQFSERRGTAPRLHSTPGDKLRSSDPQKILVRIVSQTHVSCEKFLEILHPWRLHHWKYFQCLFPHELRVPLVTTEIHWDDFGQKEGLHYKGLREHRAGMNHRPGIQQELGIQTALEISLQILLWLFCISTPSSILFRSDFSTLLSTWQKARVYLLPRFMLLDC